MSLLGSFRLRLWGKKASSSPAFSADSPEGAPAGGLSRDDILWAYRLLLDREAGPLDDVAAKLATFSSTRELRAAFSSTLPSIPTRILAV